MTTSIPLHIKHHNYTNPREKLQGLSRTCPDFSEFAERLCINGENIMRIMHEYSLELHVEIMRNYKI